MGVNDGQKQAPGIFGSATPVTVGFMLLVAGGIASFTWQTATSTAELRNLSRSQVVLSEDVREMKNEIRSMGTRLAALEQKFDILGLNRATASPK